MPAPLGTTAHWRLGPLVLYAWRGPNEWRVAWRSEPDALDRSFSCAVETGEAPDEGSLTVHRYAFSTGSDTIRAEPALADRPVVVQPATPLFLPPGQNATLYVSTVVWVRLLVGDEDELQLLDTPTHRPSDTWFGQSTRWGELCYASRTLARTSSAQVDDYPHRAITPVVIENSGDDLLTVEQLRVPAPNLSVYSGNDARLWTDTVVFDRRHGLSDAVLRINRKPAGEPGCEELGEPRESLQANVVVRAFSRLFG